MTLPRRKMPRKGEVRNDKTYMDKSNRNTFVHIETHLKMFFIGGQIMFKKNLKRAITLAMTACLMVSAAAGCGNSGDDKTTNLTPTTAATNNSQSSTSGTDNQGSSDSSADNSSSLHLQLQIHHPSYLLHDSFALKDLIIPS